jgi:hypothetical protein
MDPLELQNVAFDYFVDFLTMLLVLMLFVVSIFSPRAPNRHSRHARHSHYRQVTVTNESVSTEETPATVVGVAQDVSGSAAETSLSGDNGTPSPA